LDGKKTSVLHELEAGVLLSRHPGDVATAQKAVEEVRRALLSLLKNRRPYGSCLGCGLLHVIACREAGETVVVTSFVEAFPHLRHATSMPCR